MATGIEGKRPVRRLTAAGLQAFREWLGDGKPGFIAAPPPFWALESDAHSERASDIGSPAIRIDGYESAWDVAEEICGALGPWLPRLQADAALWNGISLMLADTLYPADGDGVRKTMAVTRMFLSDQSTFGVVRNKSYRHMAMAFAYFRTNLPELAPYVLSKPPHFWSDEMEQILGRPELRSNRSLRQLLDYLFGDPANSRFVRGASKRRKKDAGWVGGYRDVSQFINQVTRNYNIEGMSVEAILDLIEQDPNQTFLSALGKFIKRARKRLREEARRSLAAAA
jgi:hypothetical protein